MAHFTILDSFSLGGFFQSSGSRVWLFLAGAFLTINILAPHSAQAQGDGFSAFQPNYILGYKNQETGGTNLKFQLSVKSELLTVVPLFFGFTQTCDWHYGSPSAPFETCDYNPSVFLKWDRPVWAFSLGRDHKSNGEGSEPDENGVVRSRSMNSHFVDGEIRGDHWALGLRVWKAFNTDDSENIDKYYGIAEPRARLFLNDNFDLRITGRKGTEYGYVMTELFSKLPIPDTKAHIYLQWFQGHGEYMLNIVPEGAQADRKNQIMLGVAFTK